MSRLQRSPTRSSAMPRALVAAVVAVVGSSVVIGAHGRGGACCIGDVVVDCKSQVTTRTDQRRPRGITALMSVLNELQEAVAAVATAVGPSVVGIGSRLRGSGVVVADGRVLTNAHNLRGGEVTVRFAGGRTAVGTVKGVDWDGDLAVVEVDTAGRPGDRVGRRAAPPSARRCSPPRPPRPAGRACRSASCRPSSGRSGDPAAVASRARSSTPRRSRPGSSGQPAPRRRGRARRPVHQPGGRGLLPRLPADDGAEDAGRRAGRGETPRAPAPRHRRRARARRPPAAPLRRPAGARRGARPRRGARQPRRRRGDPGG